MIKEINDYHNKIFKISQFNNKMNLDCHTNDHKTSTTENPPHPFFSLFIYSSLSLRIHSLSELSLSPEFITTLFPVRSVFSTRCRRSPFPFLFRPFSETPLCLSLFRHSSLSVTPLRGFRSLCPSEAHLIALFSHLSISPLFLPVFRPLFPLVAL
jgi:hypothetical protein